jgi:small subunit ribosomal protein S14
MAKKCWIEKVKRTPKFKVRRYYRCRRCGRSRGTLRQVRAVPHLLP